MCGHRPGLKRRVVRAGALFFDRHETRVPGNEVIPKPGLDDLFSKLFSSLLIPEIFLKARKIKPEGFNLAPRIQPCDAGSGDSIFKRHALLPLLA